MQKIKAIKWTWSTNQFLIRYEDDTEEYAIKDQKLPSHAISEAVAKAGQWIDIN